MLIESNKRSDCNFEDDAYQQVSNLSSGNFKHVENLPLLTYKVCECEMHLLIAVHPFTSVYFRKN